MSSDITPEFALIRLHPEAYAILKQIAKERCGGDEDEAVLQAISCFQTIITVVKAENKIAIIYPDGKIRELKLLS